MVRPPLPVPARRTRSTGKIEDDDNDEQIVRKCVMICMINKYQNSRYVVAPTDQDVLIYRRSVNTCHQSSCQSFS